MNTPALISKHFREVIFGGNWTWSDLKDQLKDVTRDEAVARIGTFNSILTLVCHCHYYVKVQTRAMQGEPLNSSDEDSFATPEISTEAEWQELLATLFAESEVYAKAVEQLPESKLQETFIEEKYGNWYRNLHGLIEHTHYHLGQIALLKKMIRMEGGKR